MAIRRRQTLTAIRVTQPMEPALADGRRLTARLGDWLITHGVIVLDVCSDHRFRQEFEPIPDPGLTLSKHDCYLLEEMIGLGATSAPESLITAIDRLASMRFGDIRIPFTPGQLSEIQHRAAKRGRTVEAEMKAVVARIQDEIFHRGG